jgi:hypothetical protein
MRKLVMIVCLGVAMACSAIYRVADDFFRFVFSAISSEPAFAFAGGQDTSWTGTRLTFADPHIERHEAGQSRRAAAPGL